MATKLRNYFDMKKLILKNKIFVLLIFSHLTSFSCRDTEETSSCFPHTPISVTLNLRLPAYANLQNPGGWIYVNEQTSGTRGLIVVNNGNNFMVYDRNAPHLCPDTYTTLEVVDNIKIVCPKDQSEWILNTGEPIKIAQVPPKRYLSQIMDNTLYIYR